MNGTATGPGSSPARHSRWERPFSKADIKRFGDETPPDGPILAVSVEDLSEKEAVLAAHPTSFFTIAHFNGYAAILIQLTAVSDDELTEALADGWLAVAPPALARQHFGRFRGSSPSERGG